MKLGKFLVTDFSIAILVEQKKTAGDVLAGKRR